MSAFVTGAVPAASASPGARRTGRGLRRVAGLARRTLAGSGQRMPAGPKLEPAAGTLILTTTNGTRLLVAAAERFERVYVGSLLNVDAVAAAARESGEDVAVLCAGVLGELALDDAYCAGRIAEALGGEPEDSARAAILLSRSFPNAAEGLGASRSAANLHRHGLEADVERCARENVLDVVPRYVRRVGPAAEVTV